jgi:hypothetical protein
MPTGRANARPARAARGADGARGLFAGPLARAFEGKDHLVEERHPSAVVHKTRKQAEAAFGRKDEVGRPLKIIEIDWDDTGAKKPWPP